MKREIWIGLCGRSGTGKGYVSHIFAKNGVPAVDTDAVYRELTKPGNELSPCMIELIGAFGDAVRNDDNSLNRKKLAEIVFRDGGSADLQKLNHITHKHILEKTKVIAEDFFASGAKAVLIDAPVLFESGFDAFCSCTVCVTAPLAVSVKRIIKRDGISEEDALRRLNSQVSEEELIRLCDYRIVNGENEETLEEQVAEILVKIFASCPETEVGCEQ